jgi:hypothetical protein
MFIMKQLLLSTQVPAVSLVFPSQRDEYLGEARSFSPATRWRQMMNSAEDTAGSSVARS